MLKPLKSELMPGVELHPYECVHCLEKASVIDRYNLPWCEGCDHRRRAWEWGVTHGYPDLRLPYPAIGPGVYCWQIAMMLGSDDMIGLILAYIEYLDEESAQEHI